MRTAIFVLGLFINSSFALESFETEINDYLEGPKRVCARPQAFTNEGDYRDHCSEKQRAKVSEARKEALTLLSRTYKEMQGLEKGYFSPRIKKAFSQYFKIDITDQSQAHQIARVSSLIEKIAKKAKTSKFVCGGFSNQLFCSITSQPIAGVPPGRGLVHLCGSYFKKTKEVRAATLIHEMFHQFGGVHINYLDETYCDKSGDLGRSELIRNADQYMLFIGQVGNFGKTPKCF